MIGKKIKVIRQPSIVKDPMYREKILQQAHKIIKTLFIIIN